MCLDSIAEVVNQYVPMHILNYSVSQLKNKDVSMDHLVNNFINVAIKLMHLLYYMQNK